MKEKSQCLFSIKSEQKNNEFYPRTADPKLNKTHFTSSVSPPNKNSSLCYTFNWLPHQPEASRLSTCYGLPGLQELNFQLFI